MTVPKIGDYKIKRDDTSGPLLALNARRGPVPFRSKQIVITAEAGGERAKILSIFWERQLGYYVYLGYFRHQDAVLGRYLNDAPFGQPTKFDLRKGGVASNDVLKFSHHASGQAHFSLNRRDPLLETRTPPLAVNQSGAPSRSGGFVFSAMFKDLTAFEPNLPVGPGETPPLLKTRRSLNFRHPGDPATPMKLVGWWYPIRALEIVDYASGAPWEPKPIQFRPDGRRLVTGFLLAPPLDWPWTDHGLVITDDSSNAPDSPLGAYLVFQGGFRRERDGEGNDAGDSFLAAIFADRSNEEKA